MEHRETDHEHAKRVLERPHFEAWCWGYADARRYWMSVTVYVFAAGIAAGVAVGWCVF